MTQTETHSLDFLREVVEKYTNTDIMSKSREREVIDARRYLLTYFLILIIGIV